MEDENEKKDLANKWRLGSVLAILDNEESKYSLARVLSHTENDVLAQYLGTMGNHPQTAKYTPAWSVAGDKMMLSNTKSRIQAYNL